MLSVHLAAALAVLAQPAAAAPDGVRQYQGLALSPGGDRFAAVESVETADTSKAPHGAVVVRSARDGSVLQRLDPCTTCSYAGLAWSPKGDTLAFVASDTRLGTATLEAATGANLRQVVSLKGVASTPRWSPDGATLALLATPGARKETGATQAGAPLVGEIGADEDEQRIAVVPAAGGELRLVSPSDTFVYEYDWTPDGRGFVATAAKGNGDNNWWVAKLEAVDAATGAVRELAAPKFQINTPRVSPDGKTVLFIGGLMSDFGSIGGDLYSVPFTGGTPVNLTEGFKGTFTSLSWRGKQPTATALVGDKAAVIAVEPDSRKLRTLWSAPVTLQAGDARVSLSADGGRAATVAQDFNQAPRVLAGPVGAMAAVTHDNDALSADLSARSVSWTNDGHDAQGWLLGPKTTVPGKTYPMIVLIHGGPSAAATPSFLARGTVRQLISRGYFVFQPNPRGSYGQGEAFTRANVRDFGGGDLRDILAGVDAVEKVAPVDDKRLGVYGHSYGGFMTMWTVTHSQRFRAAVAGAGIANWISYYGQNGIDQWMVPFFGSTAYDDPAVYRAASPIESIKAAKTPTFVYVGERDVECPPAQSIEFWHGLKAMGVPTTLMIYEGEGHRLRKPEHVHDLDSRIVGWFDQHLGG